MKIVVAASAAILACAYCDSGVMFSKAAYMDGLSGTSPHAQLAVQVHGHAEAGTESVVQPRTSAPSLWPRLNGPPTGAVDGYLAPRPRIDLLIAGQKTVAPRATDTLEVAHEEKLETVEERVRLREMEDVYFAYKAMSVGRRMEGYFGKSGDRPQFAFPKTGAELLAAMIAASRRGAIANLVVFGHSGPNGLYMLEDRGFYRAVKEVARTSSVVDGTMAEKEEKLRALGARDFGDLEVLIKRGDIRLTSDAVIVFTGCSVAGEADILPDAFAAKTAEVTGAIVFGSVNVTDDSIAQLTGSFWHNEYSTGTWVRFEKGARPTNLNTHTLDVLEQLNLKHLQDRIRRFEGFRSDRREASGTDGAGAPAELRPIDRPRR